MAVALTGGTGLVGTEVLRALIASGHDVVALVRSDDAAAKVRAAGATAAVGDLSDRNWVRDQFAATDGAIHTASPGDATSADFDATVASAAEAAFAGTGKPYLHTGGVWVYGSGTDITERTSFDAPELTAWRPGVEDGVLAADLRGVIIVPGVVYQGPADGLPALVAQPGGDGAFRLIGDGAQHWATVSTQQLADLYVRAFDNASARGYYLGVNDDHPTVREIAEAAAAGAEVIAETPDETRARLFAPLVDALLLDQQASNAKARDELGWDPTGPSLLDAVSRR